MKKTPLIVLFLTCIMGLVACASNIKNTELVERWHDEDFHGPKLQKVLVLGLFKNDEQRRLFEHTFTKLVDSTGKQAVAGHTLMPNPEDFDTKEDIRAEVKKISADSVLITSFKGLEEEKRQVPARVDYLPRTGQQIQGNTSYIGYYGSAYQKVHRPAYTTTDSLVQLDTRIYSVKTEKLIWAGKTKSVNPTSATNIIEELVSLVIEDVRKSGLIK